MLGVECFIQAIYINQTMTLAQECLFSAIHGEVKWIAHKILCSYKWKSPNQYKISALWHCKHHFSSETFKTSRTFPFRTMPGTSFPVKKNELDATPIQPKSPPQLLQVISDILSTLKFKSLYMAKIVHPFLLLIMPVFPGHKFFLI